jgi:hypothetical protein
MAHFVQAFGNTALGYPYINLDAVVTIRNKDDGKAGYDCYDKNEVRLGTIGSVPQSPLVVPNALSGIVAVSFWEEHGGAVVDPDRHAIVAWQIDGRCAIPITVESMSDVWCIEQQLGLGEEVLYVFPEDRTFKTFADAWKYAVTQFPRYKKG